MEEWDAVKDVRSRLAGAAVVIAFLGIAAAAVETRRHLTPARADDRAALAAQVRRLPQRLASHRRLARYDLAAGRPAAALHDLAAIEAPFSAELWLDRAEAAMQAGRVESARRAAERAVVLAPVDASACERAALVLLQLGDTTGAAPYLRCQVAYADRVRDVLDLAHAVYADEATVLTTVVPAEATQVRRYLGWAYDRGLLDAAKLGWTALVSYAPTDAERLRHADFLLKRGEIADADALWATVFGEQPVGRIFDGGFEKDPVNAGFGWMILPLDGARMTLNATAAAHGRRGLAIEFRGGNLDFAHVGQVVRVAGARRYRLSALVDADRVTSVSGPRFRIEGYGVGCAGMQGADSRELKGTKAWSTVAVEFETPPSCEAVIVRIVRPPTDRLDRDLRGRLEIDDVTLLEVGAADARVGL